MEYSDSWTQLFIGIIINAVIAFVLIVLFRYKFTPRIDKIVDRNIKYIDNMYFSHIHSIDGYQKNIMQLLQSNSKFNLNQNTTYEYESHTYNEIIRYHKLILKEIETIQSFKDLPGDIDIQHFVAVQRYTSTSYQFIAVVGNVENGISFRAKELERRKFYAKEIVNKFGKSADEFKRRWSSEFSKSGGMDNVKNPPLEPGDIVGLDLNINDELLLWNPKFSRLEGELQRIRSNINENKS